MSVKVKFDSSGGNLDQETQKQADSFERLRAAERRARVEAQELNQLVKKGAKSAATATSDHKRQVEILNRALKAGAINQKEFDQAIKSVNSEFRKGQKTAAGFAVSALKGATALTGFASAQGVLSGIKSLFSEIDREAQEAADSIGGAISSIGQLQQISDNKEDFERLLGDVSEIRATGAVDRSQAADLAFTFDSLGIDKTPFLDLAKSGVVAGDGLEQLAQAVSSMSKNFQGLGTETDILSKGFAAAAESPANIQQVLRGAGFVAPAAKSVGLKGDEALAGISVLSEVLPSVEIATTRFRGFLNAANRKGISGGSLEEIVRNTQKAIAGSGKSSLEFLGSSEGDEGFQNLQSNLAKLGDVLGKVNVAAERNLVQQKTGIASTNFGVKSSLNLRTTKADGENIKKEAGEVENQQDAIKNQLQNLRFKARSPVASRISSALTRDVFNDFFNIDGASLRTVELYRDLIRSKPFTGEERSELTEMVNKLEEMVLELRAKREEEKAKQNQRVVLPNSEN